MKNVKKKLILCGLLTVFAIANLFVAVSNERQKTMFTARDAEAQVVQSIPWEVLYQIWERYNTYNNPVVFKYRERNNLTCSPFEIYKGVFAKGSEVARMLDAHLNIQGAYGTSTGQVSGNTNVNYSASKKSTDNYSYEYSVSIILAGDDWTVKTCEQCSENDPDMIGMNCTVYNECAQTIESNANAYKAALGLY